MHVSVTSIVAELVQRQCSRAHLVLARLELPVLAVHRRVLGLVLLDARRVLRPARLHQRHQAVLVLPQLCVLRLQRHHLVMQQVNRDHRSGGFARLVGRDGTFLHTGAVNWNIMQESSSKQAACRTGLVHAQVGARGACGALVAGQARCRRPGGVVAAGHREPAGGAACTAAQLQLQALLRSLLQAVPLAELCRPLLNPIRLESAMRLQTSVDPLPSTPKHLVQAQVLTHRQSAPSLDLQQALAWLWACGKSRKDRRALRLRPTTGESS